MIGIMTGTILFAIFIWTIIAMTGSGGFERHFKLSGIYTVLHPDGYNVVCFVDSDSKQGGVMCVPCPAIDNCQKVK